MPLLGQTMRANFLRSSNVSEAKEMSCMHILSCNAPLLLGLELHLNLQREFAKKHLPDDEMFKLVSLLFEVVPDVLLETGKVRKSVTTKKPQCTA